MVLYALLGELFLGKVLEFHSENLKYLGEAFWQSRSERMVWSQSSHSGEGMRNTTGCFSGKGWHLEKVGAGAAKPCYPGWNATTLGRQGYWTPAKKNIWNKALFFFLFYSKMIGTQSKRESARYGYAMNLLEFELFPLVVEEGHVHIKTN